MSEDVWPIVAIDVYGEPTSNEKIPDRSHTPVLAYSSPAETVYSYGHIDQMNALVTLVCLASVRCLALVQVPGPLRFVVLD